jgi:hypothetical protein
VTHSLPDPKYKIGDFVGCWYVLYQYYYYHHHLYGDGFDKNEAPVYGVIVEIDFAQYDEEWNYDVIYVVYCTDGIYRFFLEEELWKMA